MSLPKWGATTTFKSCDCSMPQSLRPLRGRDNVTNVDRSCKDALNIVDNSGKSHDSQNSELKNSTICTNCRNLSI